MLTESEINTLIVEDKWMVALGSNIEAKLERILQTFLQRINELAEKYTDSMSKLEAQIVDLTKKVEAHLEKMGFRI